MITEAKKEDLLESLLAKCRNNLPSVNEDLIRKSFKMSYEAHKNDVRASGDPYFLHPYEVANIIVEEIPLDDISVVSALLHDVVEDTEISLKFLAKEFGPEIAEIVDGVTKMGGVFKGHEIYQAENYRKLLLSMVKDVRVILVKFADRLHNMRTLDFVRPEKQRRIAKETLEIYAPFTNRFGLGRVKWELEDLSFKYLNKEAYVQDVGTDTDIYERFETLMEKLSSQPPIPAGEGLDSVTMTRNVYHFYRVLEEDEIRLIKQILKNEADDLEINLDTFFQWLIPADPCPDSDQDRPSLDVLYQYAGFFSNTIGGRAYLFRRPTPVRLLTSYYALLIIHEADKRGKNTYGIDIFPEITRLAREISLYPDFELQNTYLQQLTELQDYYLERR